MNEKHLNKVKVLLVEWNPLGQQSSLITDLNNYEIEATDILWHIKSNNTVDYINKMVNTVLSQAFGIQVDPVKCKSIAKKIHKIINEK